MKKIFILLFFIILCGIQTFANTVNPQQSIQSVYTPIANVPFEKCLKTFSMKYDDLFFQTVSSISLNNFKIIELQSRNSRIIFSAYNREFFATIDKLGSSQSSLKIVPANNNYAFSYEIIQRIFNTIDLNKNNKVTKVNS